MAYQPMLTIDGSDTVNIGLTIQGKRFDAVFKKNRFERVMDKVDNSILRGKDLETIKRKYADHIVSIKPHGKDAPAPKTAKPVEFDKIAHVKQYIDQSSGSELGTIAKSAAATSAGRLTYANARYIAQKFMNQKPQSKTSRKSILK